MNRISRRPAAKAAEALLEVGRTQPVLHYDVELGLERHHHWLRSGAPLPEWASAGAGVAAKSLAPVVIKTIVSALLIGVVGAAVWRVYIRPQPSAAVVKPSADGVEPEVARSVPDVSASADRLATTPLPVPEPGLPLEHPARRAAPDKRSARAARAHRDLASARTAVPRAEPIAAATTAPATAPSSANVSEERVPQAAVAAAPEPSLTPKPVAVPRQEAQAPSDLAEMQQVATAEQLLERSPQRALTLVRQGDQRFARGYFQQERAYIAIMALIRLGRINEARSRAAGFSKQFPALPYGARIRRALEAAEAAPPAARGAVR